MPAHLQANRLVSASEEETKTAIAALLSLGSDLPQPDQDATAENVQLVPINPIAADTIPINPVIADTIDDNEPSTSKSISKEKTELVK